MVVTMLNVEAIGLYTLSSLKSFEVKGKQYLVSLDQNNNLLIYESIPPDGDWEDPTTEERHAVINYLLERR